MKSKKKIMAYGLMATAMILTGSVLGAGVAYLEGYTINLKSDSLTSIDRNTSGNQTNPELSNTNNSHYYKGNGSIAMGSRCNMYCIFPVVFECQYPHLLNSSFYPFRQTKNPIAKCNRVSWHFSNLF